MAKVDLGEKRVCPECEAKFYDLTKNPATCPMCQHSFDPAELEPKPILPLAPLEPEKADKDDDEDGEAKPPVDEEDIDEEEEAAKELELDGDDAVFAGSSDDDKDAPEFDGFSTDEDEDQDAALVDDEDDNVMPPPDDKDDDEEIEEVEI